MNVEACAFELLTLLRIAAAPMAITGLYQRLRASYNRATVIAAVDLLLTAGWAFACTVDDRQDCLTVEPPAAPARAPLTPALQRVYQVVDGPLTSVQIANKLGISRARATTALCILTARGWLERVGAVPHPTAGMRAAYAVYQPTTGDKP